MEHKVTNTGEGDLVVPTLCFPRGPDLPPGCCEVWLHGAGGGWELFSVRKRGFRGVGKEVRAGWLEGE